MSLQIWLPLNGNLHNQGLQSINITNNGAISNDNGKIGKCYYFNNSTINFDSFETTKSICFWIKAEKVAKAAIAFVDYKTNLAFGFGSDGNIVVSCGEDSSIAKKRYISSTFLSNVWTHIVLVKKDLDVELWINGILQTARGNNNYYTCSVDKCYIGGRSTGANLECYLNDFRIYNHQLSEKEIKKLSRGLILHYPLNRRGLGENLLKASDVSVTNSSYPTRSYYFGENPPQEGEQVTIQIKGHLADTKSYWRIYNSGGTVDCIIIQKTAYNEHTGIYTATGTWKISKEGKPDAANTYLNVYPFTKTQSGESTIEWIKLERGNHATPWCPNAADEKYALLGLNNNIQYDISGFQNNGTKNNITYNSDAPKYNVSSVFNSADTSYIKVNENNWMGQYATVLTVNTWVYASNWSNLQKLYSCIQTGGWGTSSSGDEGYLGFTIHVATTETKDTYIYKGNTKALKISDITPGWHMITFLYDSNIGYKVYLDGELHSSLNFTSYGVHYNENTRLFLGCEAGAAVATTPYFDGKFSDFRVYATVLSEKDILSLYNNEAYIDQLNAIHGEIR